MWQEHHLTRYDEVWNMIGCLFMLVCVVVGVIIGVRDVGVGSRQNTDE